MGRPIRNKDPELIHLSTIRTCGGAFFMRPSENVNKLLGGIIARYQELLGIEIFAYCVLSDHKHLMYRCPRGNIDEFEENVNREISKRLNMKLQREGKLFSRRYDSQAILTEEDALKGFNYTNTNATKHGLEEDPQKWPGLCSYKHILSGRDKTYAFYHYSAREGQEKVTYHKLTLTQLPQYAHLSKKDYAAFVRDEVTHRAKELAEERRASGKGFLGAANVLRQSPFNVARTMDRSPRPFCYTGDPILRREHIKAESQRRGDYAEASARYRLGELDVEFPEHTFKPPLNRKPRSAPFEILPDDHFKISC